MQATAADDYSPLAALEPRRRWWCLLLAAAPAFLAGLDAMAVGLALPLIATHFGTGLTLAAKVSVVYLLVGACLFPLGAGLARRMGPKRLLLWGAGLFWLASALGGLSPGMGELITARAAAAVGLALACAAGLGLAGRERGLGLMLLAGALGAVVGALLGGAALQHLGWRVAFWLGLPLGALLVPAGLKLLPATPPVNRQAALDLVGALLLLGGLYFIISSLDLAKAQGLTDLRPWLALALGVGCLATLWPWERRSPQPLIAPSAAGQGPSPWGRASACCAAALAGSLWFVLPFYLVELREMALLSLGLFLALLPAAALVLARLLGGPVSAWRGRGWGLLLGLGALAGVVGAESAVSWSLPASLVRGGVYFTQAGLPQEALTTAFLYAWLLSGLWALAALVCLALARRGSRSY